MPHNSKHPLRWKLIQPEKRSGDSIAAPIQQFAKDPEVVKAQAKLLFSKMPEAEIIEVYRTQEVLVARVTPVKDGSFVTGVVYEEV